MIESIPLARQQDKETFMQRFIRWPLVAFALVWISLSLGCETPRHAPPTPWTAAQIADFPSVAGKWEGILRRVPQNKRNDLVAIMIEPDGRFRFASVRTIGLLSGEGTFSLKDGKLTFHSQKFTIDAALFEADGKRMLKAEGVASDGMEYNTELTPAR
jgi:hypothetical protein